MPTVSVIMPAYNGERTILETIVSLQQQTFSDFELIVINDGSTDRTLEILSSIKEPRMKIFSYENGGLTVARNRGLAHVTGEFVAFLDQDDLWTSDKLELQLAALQNNPEAGVAYSWTSFMGENKEWFYSGNHVTFEGNVYAELLIDNFLDNGSNPLICRQAIESVGKFDPIVGPCDDWDYWLRLAAQWPFVLVPKEQNFYRQSSTSLTSKVEVINDASLLVLEKAFKSAPQEIQHLKNQCFSNIYLYTAELYLRHGKQINDVNKSGHFFWKAIRLYPQILKDKKNRKLVKWAIKKLFLRRFKPTNHSISQSQTS